MKRTKGGKKYTGPEKVLSTKVEKIWKRVGWQGTDACLGSFVFFEDQGKN